MNIAICVDDAYVLPARVLLKSLAAHNQSIALKLVYCGLKQENLDHIAADATSYGWEISLYPVPASVEELVVGLPLCLYFSKEIYYRLFLPWILLDCDRALYLDCDILIRGSIQELYDMPLEGKLFAASYDINRNLQQTRMEFSNLGADYYNSGVLLMQLEQIRSQMSVAEMTAEIQKYVSRYQLWFPDQDLLNLIFHGKILKISKRYNFSASYHTKYKLLHPVVLKQAVIVHFLGPVKPWQEAYCLFYLFAYWRYLKPYYSSKERVRYWLHKPFFRTYWGICSGYIVKICREKGLLQRYRK